MQILKTYKKEIFYSLIIAGVFAILVFLQYHLPFFQKFLPVGENKLIIAILNINLLLILLLIALIARILTKAYLENKRGVWGSRLKTKLTLTMFAIPIISSFTLFALTTGFFYVSMDKWFGQKIEDTVDNARELSRFYYDDLFGRYEKIGIRLAQEIEKKGMLGKEKQLARFLDREGKTNLLGYLAVYDLAGLPLQRYTTFPDPVHEKLSEKAKALVKGKKIRDVIPLRHGELLITGTMISDTNGKPEALLLLGYRTGVRGTESIKQITATYEQYKEARPLKKLVKYSFIIPLFLITMLTIFFSAWVGIKMAREITVPLERVKEGAEIIATGRFDINLEDRGRDEIGTLVGAFNQMAKELKIAKDEIEEKRRYMEVILDNVATGIITTDQRGNILLLNRSARTILSLDGTDFVGVPLQSIMGEEFNKIIRSFVREMRRHPQESIVKEMRLSLGKDIVYLRASLTALKDERGKKEGYISTFDDISHIVRVEKLATWREVAKKLTHEIKNPLTPIKLSAERIRRRLLPTSEGKEREILDETTSVILRASEDIKGIVNELTKLTHTSQAQTVEDVNEIVEETLALYRNLYQNIAFEFERSRVPLLRMDREKVKRAIINLITNSIKAIDTAQGAVTVSTRYDRNRGIASLEVADTGPGITDEDKIRIFDPYFTKNSDGMGLGLAIVNSIILEHHGKIHVEDNLPQGARFIIELPVVTTEI